VEYIGIFVSLLFNVVFVVAFLKGRSKVGRVVEHRSTLTFGSNDNIEQGRQNAALLLSDLAEREADELDHGTRMNIRRRMRFECDNLVRLTLSTQDNEQNDQVKTGALKNR
jgi:hypothetical protein